MAALKFIAMILTALALAPGCAHLFALPNKIAMPQDAYFIAQGIYRGWALLGVFLFGALAVELLAGGLLNERAADPRQVAALPAGLVGLLPAA